MNNVHNAYALSVDARNVIGRLYAAWKRAHKKPKDFEALLIDAGYQMTRRSLNNWNQAVVDDKEPVSVPQNAGRPRLLSDKGERVVTGYVLHQNDAGTRVTDRNVQRFVQRRMKRKISITSVRKILSRNMITSRTPMVNKVVRKIKLARIYQRWLRDPTNRGSLNVRRDLIGSLDFTYTNHRTTRVRTYAKKGR